MLTATYQSVVDVNRGTQVTKSGMLARVAAIGAAMVLMMAACGDGGGEDSAPGSANNGKSAATDFDPPSLTSAEICDTLPVGDMVAAMGADDAFSEASPGGSGCFFTFISGDTNAGDVTVTLENNGGRAGYEAFVAEWSSRGEVSALSGIGAEASLIENSSVRRVVFFDGAWVFSVNGPASSSFSFTADAARRVAETVDAAF